MCHPALQSSPDGASRRPARMPGLVYNFQEFLKIQNVFDAGQAFRKRIAP